MSWVTRPKWLSCPYMVKTIKYLLLQQPALLLGMYSIETLVLSRLFRFLQQVQQWKMVIHKIPWKVLKIWPKNWYMQLT